MEDKSIRPGKPPETFHTSLCWSFFQFSPSSIHSGTPVCMYLIRFSLSIFSLLKVPWSLICSSTSACLLICQTGQYVSAWDCIFLLPRCLPKRLYRRGFWWHSLVPDASRTLAVSLLAKKRLVRLQINPVELLETPRRFPQAQYSIYF